MVYKVKTPNHQELDFSNRIIEAHLIPEITEVAEIDVWNPKGMSDIGRVIDDRGSCIANNSPHIEQKQKNNQLTRLNID